MNGNGTIELRLDECDKARYNALCVLLSSAVTQKQRDETCIESESVRYLSFYWSL